ncbi:DSD1 family PLP-dependent enzyme [Microbulbifer sp. OS29]|uniref:DSD1 family PLP-dependent enzyme n=1 Tax=Microbulbifer okhotskensis TaxID=2926617 RepID=A0A9X2EVE4_9GAMM|nr:DSD1 family PLP-dependent enzyme [Microbulbifer okhotskensis]MCO1336651.1 DSD1 family PLP-dependent enzyme [Microbulbifer okhotskensis]
MDSKRRKLLMGGVALGAVAGVSVLRPKAQGQGGHSEYFSSVSKALDNTGFSGPTLVVDLERLQNNADVLFSHLSGHYDYRVVAKSLPSLNLLDVVTQRTKTNRIMVFQLPFLQQLVKSYPNTDILLGKPLPFAAAKAFYSDARGAQFDPSRQLQWLLDSPRRLNQYASLARSLGQSLRINIEIDVGLHRGGVANEEDLNAMLSIIQREPLLKFAGFMGYDAHAAKMPGILGGPEKAISQGLDIYRGRIEQAQARLGEAFPKAPTMNAAGSPTYQLYKPHAGSAPCSEIAAGSCLVKPAGFDLPTLSDHLPAAYIASPVLKKLSQTQIPGIEGLTGPFNWLNPNRQQTFFISGGYWKAQPESPQGLSINPIYGRSSNQEMLNGSSKVLLNEDDWVFLRPTQSESVFLQFGDIAVYNKGEIVDLWPVLGNS